MNIKMKPVVATTLTALATTSYAHKLCVFDPLGSSDE